MLDWAYHDPPPPPSLELPEFWVDPVFPEAWEVGVEVPEPALVVVVGVAGLAPLALPQNPEYQVLIVCKSLAAVQLAAPQTELTPLVPSLLNASSRPSAQKQALSAHPPWTSWRGPHRVAQAGRTDVKGTRAPSAACPWAYVGVVKARRVVKKRVEYCIVNWGGPEIGFE